MKQCKNTYCTTPTEDLVFSKNRSTADGLQDACKVCEKIRMTDYSRTIIGFSVKMYGNQVKSSKRRGHKPPTYSRKELTTFMGTDTEFQKLYKVWVQSGFVKNLAPSFDRLDEDYGYSFENIQVVTWEFNNQKQHLKRYIHEVKTNMVHKRVRQLTLENEFVAQFNSLAEAGRMTGVNYKDISSCTTGKRKTAGGFRWEAA